MSVIYLTSDFGKMYKKGDTIQLVTEDGSVAKTIFPHKTEQLIIIGKVEITSSVLKLLMKHNIDTVFLSSNGKFNGKISFQLGKNVFLRQKQYELLKDEQFRTNFAKIIVSSKIKNQLTFVQRINRKLDRNIEDTINFIKNTLKKVELADSIDTIRGLEGVVSKAYFSIFKYAIHPEWAVFKRRSMHPPEDNVNAVLSFLYTLILFRVDGAVESFNIDSYAGYFHSLNYGKKSLVYDLMEEYRTPLADTLAIALFNLGVLNESDFREVDFNANSEDYAISFEDNAENDNVIIESKKGVLLTKEGLKKVITQFEKKLDTEYYYPPLLKPISYKKLILEQVKSFKNVITQEQKEYKPLIIK